MTAQGSRFVPYNAAAKVNVRLTSTVAGSRRSLEGNKEPRGRASVVLPGVDPLARAGTLLVGQSGRSAFAGKQLTANILPNNEAAHSRTRPSPLPPVTSPVRSTATMATTAYSIGSQSMVSLAPRTSQCGEHTGTGPSAIVVVGKVHHFAAPTNEAACFPAHIDIPGQRPLPSAAQATQTAQAVQMAVQAAVQARLPMQAIGVVASRRRLTPSELGIYRASVRPCGPTVLR